MNRPTLTRRQRIEQERAQFALGRVRDVGSKGFAAKYRQEVLGLPAMVLTNGLGQTLAFLKAKGGVGQNEHSAVYEHLSAWVLLQLRRPGDLLEEVTKMDVGEYRLAQAEALAVLGWLKRFAEAELPREGVGA